MLRSEPLWDEDFDRRANEVCPSVAKEPFGLRVDENDVTVAVHDDDGIGSSFQEITESVLDALVRPDVARDRRGADDRALAVADGRLGGCDRDDTSALLDADAFVARDRLSRSDPLKHRRRLILAILGDEGGERRPDHLLGRIAVEPLCGLIPARDDAFEVAAHYRVIGGIDDRCKE